MCLVALGLPQTRAVSHIYQTSVWRGGGRGGGICKQKLTCNIKLHFRWGGGICKQKLKYNIKLQFGGVGVGEGVYMSKS